MQAGDTVRYLNSVGGGIVTRIDGKIAYVDDNGFETPMLIKELVVVLPAGHQPPASGAKLMFDQSAFDTGKSKSRPKSAQVNGNSAAAKSDAPTASAAPAPTASQPEALPPAPETDYGNRISLSLAFEPSNLKSLDNSEFNAVLVNDSNYRLQFTLAGRDPERSEWHVIYQGDVEANEIIDLCRFSHSTLGRIERVVLQAIASKPEKPYEIKEPISIMRKIDLTKFHKLHCFRPSRYFDSPVLEFPIISDGRTTPQPR